MTLEKAITNTQQIIEGKQDPDSIIFTKQWDEFGQLKGWIVEATFGSKTISLDMTQHYTRFIGDFGEIPKFISGIHQKV